MPNNKNESDTQKNMKSRFEKDVKGALTTLLVIGIIIKEKRIWSYQIKKKLKNITKSEEKINNSSLYTLLGRLENDYGFIRSKKDDEVQRRYYYPTEICESEYNQLKKYWFQIMEKSKNAISNLEMLMEKEI